MGKLKRKFSKEFKLKVALELIRAQETISSICSRYQIHPTQANRWKEIALSNIANGFDGEKTALDEQKRKDGLIDELYRQVGQLKVMLDWLKKNMGAA